MGKPDQALRTVRSASLLGYRELAQSLGLEPQAAMRQAGLPPRCLEDPETLVSADAVRELLERSAQATGTEDFGLRMAAGRQFSDLGPISLVLKEEPTVRQALETLFRYLRLLNASLLTRLDEAQGTVTIREELLGSNASSHRQSIELAVGVMYRIVRELAGPGWRPLRVCFTHRAPRHPAGHRALFGPCVDFNSDFNGIVCAAADLQARPPQSGEGLARFARQYLEQALARQQRGSGETSDTVRQLVIALLPGGRCTAQQVAQHLCVDRRTLHRHLAAEGTAFSKLLDEVRAELAMRQIQDSDLPLAEIAGLLGFSAPSAFGHWFRTFFGCSASRWRAGQRQGLG